MSTGAIVMMLIGCIGLWGGLAVSIGIEFHCNKKNVQQSQEKEK